MTPTAYLAALKRLGWSKIGAAKYLGVTQRTAQRYAKDGPPPPVARLLGYIERYGPGLAREYAAKEMMEGDREQGDDV